MPTRSCRRSVVPNARLAADACIVSGVVGIRVRPWLVRGRHAPVQSEGAGAPVRVPGQASSASSASCPWASVSSRWALSVRRRRGWRVGTCRLFGVRVPPAARQRSGPKSRVDGRRLADWASSEAPRFASERTAENSISGDSRPSHSSHIKSVECDGSSITRALGCLCVSDVGSKVPLSLGRRNSTSTRDDFVDSADSDSSSPLGWAVPA